MGVKQLWTLLTPVGRPVLLETMEGKTMAIDSSIWLYQFQATMRDKDGRALVNAHVLGFLRRICKLLFYGIKPVFVFDGGAPALKRITITERRRKKAGATDSHAKIAEKLLAAHMRREAINQVEKEKKTTSAGYTTQAPVILDENTIYLEDLINDTPHSTPSKVKNKGKRKETEKNSTKTPDSASKRAKFHDHDPYRLPDVDLATISQPTSTIAPDPRLATEEELRVFIDAMRPEDFDVSSSAFRELPTEVQYEIIGDLRLKSRQTSYKRLQTMLQNSRTPLDFSRAQIRNLQQRNTLTQQLLVTTDTIGKAGVVIPVRIASERNKEYVLVKNDNEEGGWVLGIKDEGTQAKPILIDEDRHTSDDDDSDLAMEETSTPGNVTYDPDLREYQGRMALAAVAERHAPKKAKHGEMPLFVDEDAELQIALQESLEQQEEEALRQVLEASTKDTISDALQTHTSPADDYDDDLYVPSSSRLDTALSFANTTPNRRSTLSMFGTPTFLLSGGSARAASDPNEEDDDMDMEEVVVPHMPSNAEVVAPLLVESDDDMEAIEILSNVAHKQPSLSGSDREEGDMVKVATVTTSESNKTSAAKVWTEKASELAADTPIQPLVHDDDDGDNLYVIPSRPALPVSKSPSPPRELQAEQLAIQQSPELVPTVHTFPLPIVSMPGPTPSNQPTGEEITEDEFPIEWERYSSSTSGLSSKPPHFAHDDAEEWDAAQEMDVVAEEGDFVEFISQVKGQDLEAARREIDSEIRELNKQKKVAMRDSEDVTQQMISQIMLMLRLFGIPYITAPMEAEAQCAALVSLGLVEGIITDDSDVFLFGGQRVFKNMFNQSKTVECFLLSDLARELGLDRDKLVRLTYLLGSDYVDGLSGVGPVVAMELLKEFPGEDGLHKFRGWWRKVQSGKDTAIDTQSAFRKRFKKRFKDLYLPEEWPNPAVRDAYYHPAVDESEEPFKWGLPDLDALHQFFQDELSWSQSKVDDLLVPIIRKMGQRGQAAATNRQGTLDCFFNASLGNGTYAPRRRQAYSSKRLQQVVADFRASQRNNGSATVSDAGEEIPAVATKKRKGKEKEKQASSSKRDRGGDDMIDEDVSRSETPPPPALAAKLRTRSRPKYKVAIAAEDDVDGIEKDSSEDEFVVKRRRKA
ncbi:hypothetical protein BU17DRAFT_77279 [Hysterangium stoloniferum]|nr:hypothetical protein BU17DRAFT_77279 [Hysterangium stoloniferum]